jgi:outer membrane protein OmpA-like peptidoglycan-associated protein
MKTVMSVMIILLTSSAVSAQSDVSGSRDHPMFTRMKDFYITSYEVKEFDTQEFTDSKGRDLSIEGKTYIIEYYMKEGAREITPIQIIRNFENAAKKAGGTFYEYTDNTVFLNITKGGAEVWARVNATSESYLLTITEKEALKQEVTASDMLDKLNKDGFIALYINFDVNKAVIKPDSMATVEQIAVLLKDNPDLKVSIEGHTDNTGTPAKNKILSQQRADAVKAAVAGQGVSASRMTTTGWGQDKPVADNSTEEGRAKNRRVEIVKK